MIEELIKIANELDNRALAKEADSIDAILMKIAVNSYTNGELVDVKYNGKWYPAKIMGESHSRADTYRVSYIGYPPKWNEYIELSGNSSDRIKPQGSEVNTSFWEDAKKVLYEIPKAQWGKGVPATIDMFAEETLEALLQNPDMVSFASLMTKVAAVGAIVFPEPATTATGVAVLKGSAILDIMAAIGYFSKGQSLEGWFSIISAIASVPAGPSLRAFMFVNKLRHSGQLVLLAKGAPIGFTASLVLGIEGLLEIIKATINGIDDENSNLNKAMAQSDITSTGLVKINIKSTGKVLMRELEAIRNQLEEPEQTKEASKRISPDISKMKKLSELANKFDSKGFIKEADIVDNLIKLSTDSDEFGELVDLDEYRKKKKDKSEGRRTPEEYKSYLAENWPEIQKAIDALDETSPEDMFFHLIVLDDDETYSSEASIVKATPEQMEQIEEGQKVYDVVPPSQWQDVWNLISSEDV